MAFCIMGCTCMTNPCCCCVLRRICTENVTALDGRLRVTFRCKNDGERMLIFERNVHGCQGVVGSTKQKFTNVSFDEGECYLALWITKSYIEFNNVWITFCINHEAHVQHTSIGNMHGGEMRKHRLHNLLQDLLMNTFGNDGSWTISTHSTGIWTSITIIGSLVILACWETNVSGFLHHYQHAGFFSGQKSLQQNMTIGLDRFVNKFQCFLAI